MRTCTRAGSTSGIPPPPSRLPALLGCSRPGSMVSRCGTTTRTLIYLTSSSATHTSPTISWNTSRTRIAGSNKMTEVTEVRRYGLSHLDYLESEAIFIIREIAAENESPGLLFSGGKDSVVMLHLATKAFAPGPIPFPVVHIDTGQNFAEVLELRDRRVAELGVRLIVGSVQEAIDAGWVREERNGSRNRAQTPVLLKTAEDHGLSALMGGARRDEEKARAKERVFSFRDDFGQWDPKNQRPELWSQYNGRIHPGESIRCFPLSNWTELDVWHYIAREKLRIPEIYFAAEREVFERGGMYFAVNEFCQPREGEEVFAKKVRYRTVGDATLTAAVPSTASTLEEIIAEIAVTRVTERGATRGDDRVSEAAMERSEERRGGKGDR